MPANARPAIAPTSERDIDGRAFGPGDVIRSLAVMMTDPQDIYAEGPIVLAPARAYAIEASRSGAYRRHRDADRIDMGTLHEAPKHLFTAAEVAAQDCPVDPAIAGAALIARFATDRRCARLDCQGDLVS